MSKSAESLSAKWRVATIGSVCSKPQYGWTTSAAESGDVKLLRTTDITHGPVDWNTVPFCKDNPPDVDKYLLAEGDIVVSRAGSVGVSCRVVAPERSVFASYLIRFRPKEDVDGQYLAYVLQSPAYWAQVRGSTSGIALPNVNASKLEAFEIPLAPLPEQRRIVGEIEKQFSRLEEGVGALKRVQANLKRYRAAVLKAACEGQLVPTGTRWKKSDLGEVLTGIEAGRSFRCVERPPTPDEIGVVKVSAVTWGTYDEMNSKTCLDASRMEERYFVRPDDFLFSRANTIELIGACVIAKNVTLRVMLSDKILRFRFSSCANPRWVLYWLRSGFGRSEIERLATGNQDSMRNIGQDRIRQIRIKLPPLAEQSRIVSEVERRLSVVEEMEATVEANLQRATRLRQSILQRAFAGELA